MAHVILFHSMLGLRPVEQQFGELLRTAGHVVTLPDLYAGASADDLDGGFEIKRQTGWDLICARAREALSSTPDDAVLAGISMGAGVIAELWPSRPLTPKVLLLHGIAGVPSSARPGAQVHLHISDVDPFFPGSDIVAWQNAAEACGADAQVFRYPQSGHYFSDAESPDFNPLAAAQMRKRVLRFLG